MRAFIQIQQGHLWKDWATVETKEHEFISRQDAAQWARTTVALMPSVHIRLTYPNGEALTTQAAQFLSGSYFHS